MKNERITQVDVDVDRLELQSIEDCINNRWLTEGKKTSLLQSQLQDFTNAEFVTFAPNGTLGLFLCLLALDLPKGSEIIVPSFTFYASAAVCVFAGLKPVFVDVDENTFNVVPEQIEAAITKNTSAIMAVHIYGQSCDIMSIKKIADKHNLKVIEDAAQALGVKNNGVQVGTIGDVGMFSFFSDKIITMGEGAAIVTQDSDLFAKIKLLRNQGRPFSSTFIHPELGMNFRITDIQAAIGLIQLSKFDKILNRRLKLYNYYLYLLQDLEEISYMHQAQFSNLVPFRFCIKTVEKERLQAYLESSNIDTRSFFYPMHLQPKLQQYKSHNCVVSEKLNAQGLCLPVHCNMNEEKVEYICNTIKAFYGT